MPEQYLASPYRGALGGQWERRAPARQALRAVIGAEFSVGSFQFSELDCWSPRTMKLVARITNPKLPISNGSEATLFPFLIINWSTATLRGFRG